MFNLSFKKISVYILVLFSLIFSSCNFLEKSLEADETETLNNIYNDTFSLISSEQKNQNLKYSYYSSEKLNKVVTVIQEVTKRKLFSVTSRSYSNYLALKYESESIKSLDEVVKELYLSQSEYRIFFDNKIYTSVYTYENFDDFDSLSYFRFNDSDLIKNEEKIFFVIKKSVIEISADKYINAVCYDFSKSSNKADIIVMFVNDSINLEEVENSNDIETLYKSKKYEDCFKLTYDSTYCYRGVKL